MVYSVYRYHQVILKYLLILQLSTLSVKLPFVSSNLTYYNLFMFQTLFNKSMLSKNFWVVLKMHLW